MELDNWSLDNLTWIIELEKNNNMDRKLIFLKKELCHQTAKLFITNKKIKYEQEGKEMELKDVENIYIQLRQLEILELYNKAKHYNVNVDKIIDRYRFF
jgi:hypothetical protein